MKSQKTHILKVSYNQINKYLTHVQIFRMFPCFKIEINENEYIEQFFAQVLLFYSIWKICHKHFVFSRNAISENRMDFIFFFFCSGLYWITMNESQVTNKYPYFIYRPFDTNRKEHRLRIKTWIILYYMLSDKISFDTKTKKKSLRCLKIISDNRKKK